MNNLKNRDDKNIRNVILKKKPNFLYAEKSCNVLNAAGNICNNGIPFTKFKFPLNKRYNIYKCSNKRDKTQIRAFKTRGIYINVVKNIHTVEKLTNEICTYLHFKKMISKRNILKKGVMNYYGAFSCDNVAYIHTEANVYGNANVALSKMYVSDREYIRNLLVQIVGVLYAVSDVLHGNLTLKNIHVQKNNYKMLNFSNGVVKTGKKYITNVYNDEYKVIKNGNYVTIQGAEKIKKNDAEKVVASCYIKGVNVMDIYILLVSIALHARFKKFYIDLHENKDTLEYILQSVWKPSQRAMIQMRINRMKSNDLLSCVRFLTTPFSNGEYIMMDNQIVEKILKKLLKKRIKENVI
jgi:hypothetical protein